MPLSRAARTDRMKIAGTRHHSPASNAVASEVEHQRLVVRGLAALRLDGRREGHEAAAAWRARRAAPHEVDAVRRPLGVAGVRRPWRCPPLSRLPLERRVGIDEARGAHLLQARLLDAGGRPAARRVVRGMGCPTARRCSRRGTAHLGRRAPGTAHRHRAGRSTWRACTARCSALMWSRWGHGQAHINAGHARARRQ